MRERRGQFEAWPDSILELYRDDLRRARNDGRNLVEEKYIRMMEHTSRRSMNCCESAFRT